MTRKELKAQAQDALMYTLASAFYTIDDDPDLSDAEKATLTAEADRQMRRIERLFGYEPGSWGRN